MRFVEEYEGRGALIALAEGDVYDEHDFTHLGTQNAVVWECGEHGILAGDQGHGREWLLRFADLVSVTANAKSARVTPRESLDWAFAPLLNGEETRLAISLPAVGPMQLLLRSDAAALQKRAERSISIPSGTVYESQRLSDSKLMLSIPGGSFLLSLIEGIGTADAVDYLATLDAEWAEAS